MRPTRSTAPRWSTACACALPHATLAVLPAAAFAPVARAFAEGLATGFVEAPAFDTAAAWVCNLSLALARARVR